MKIDTKERYWRNLSLTMLPGEVWLPVNGYESLYEISSLGRIKRLNIISTIGVPYSEKILKQQINRKGYLRIGLRKNNIQTNYSVHRLVGIAFISNPENKPEVNHKWGIKTDNRYTELEWSTTKENIQDAYDKGIKSAKGEKNNFSKYSEEIIRSIRKEYVIGKYGEKERLSKKYNIPKGTVKNIALCRSWKHINLNK